MTLRKTGKESSGLKPNKKIRKGFDLMKKIEWARKFTSRKFLCAVVGFITALMFALKFDNAAIEQVISVVTAAFVLIAYIVGEGMVDASNKDKED